MNPVAIVRWATHGYRRRPWPWLLLLFVVAVLGFGSWFASPHPSPSVVFVCDHTIPAFLTDGEQLLSGPALERGSAPMPGTIQFWDVRSGARRRIEELPYQPNRCLLVSPDTRWAVLRERGGRLTLWDTLKGTQAAEFSVRDTDDPEPAVRKAPEEIGSLVRFSPDSRLLALSVPGEREICLWDLQRNRERGRIAAAAPRFAERVAFSPDGQRGASVNHEGGVELWELSEGLRKTSLASGPNPVEHLAFSPDGRLLAGTNLFTGTRYSVQLWDVTSGRLRDVISRGGVPNQTRYAFHLVFSPDSRLLLGPDGETETLLWDVTTSPPRALDPRIRVALDPPEEGGNGPFFGPPGPVFSPDGRWIGVTRREPANCTILDASTLQRYRVIPPDEQGGATMSLAFDPKGSLVAVERLRTEQVRVGTGYFGPPMTTSRFVYSVQVYDLATGAQIGEFPGGRLRFTSDGRSIVTYAEDYSRRFPRVKTTVRRWELYPGPPVSLVLGIAATALFVVLSGFCVTQRILARWARVPPTEGRQHG